MWYLHSKSETYTKHYFGVWLWLSKKSGIRRKIDAEGIQIYDVDIRELKIYKKSRRKYT